MGENERVSGNFMWGCGKQFLLIVQFEYGTCGVCPNFVYTRYHASLYVSKYRKDAPATPPKYNELDGNVNRKSYEGVYQLIDRVPR